MVGVRRRSIIAEMRDEGGNVGGVIRITDREVPGGIVFLGMGKADIHRHQNREHQSRQQGRPLQQEAQKDGDEADILGVTDDGIGAGGRQFSPDLGGMQHMPCPGDDDEPGGDQH